MKRPLFGIVIPLVLGAFLGCLLWQFRGGGTADRATSHVRARARHRVSEPKRRAKPQAKYGLSESERREAF